MNPKPAAFLSLWLILAAIALLFLSCEDLNIERIIKIETGVVSDTAATSAKITGKIIDAGEDEIIHYGHCWASNINPTPVPGHMDAKGPTNARVDFSSTLSSLTPDTEYHVRAFACNSKDTVYGADVVFRTPGSAPVADFTASDTVIEEGQNILFVDQSINNPTSWSWDFGDGGNSTERNPSHAYTGAGIYSVTLAVSNSFGSDTLTKYNYITVSAIDLSPVAAFVVSSSEVLEGQNVFFVDQSTKNPTSWSWDFGDGETNKEQNTSHAYSIAGTYSVTLAVSNSFGSDTLTKTDYIKVSEDTTGTFTDTRDIHEYKWIKIGNQIWMAENLAYLPEVSPSSEGSDIYPYFYVYDYIGYSVSEAKATTNYTNYGVLYNWSAMMNGASSSNTNPSGIQGVCPGGWHLPSDAEWTELTEYLGGESVAGGKLKETENYHWLSPNEGATNSSGFTALPGGYRNFNGVFYNIGNNGYWWSATLSNASDAWVRSLYYNYTFIHRYYYYKDYGFSIRCVRN